MWADKEEIDSTWNFVHHIIQYIYTYTKLCFIIRIGYDIEIGEFQCFDYKYVHIVQNFTTFSYYYTHFQWCDEVAWGVQFGPPW